MNFLSWLEQTAFCSWIRDSGSIWAYPLVLTLHTTGMGVLVGFNWALDLRLLGVARQIPVRALQKFFPIMWIGFWVNLTTGLVLLAADATTKMTSWVFGVKMLFIVMAMIVLVKMQKGFRSTSEDKSGQSASRETSPEIHSGSADRYESVAVLPEVSSLALGLSAANARTLAWLSLLLWTLSITAGRLMAYLGPVSGLK